MGVAASRSNAAIRYERKAPHVGPQHAPVLEYPALGPVTGVADRHDSLQADFVIIGGDTAGCVLADRLSAFGRHPVLRSADRLVGNDWFSTCRSRCAPYY